MVTPCRASWAPYLEKNIQAFMEIQQRMAEQSKGLYGSQFGPEAWTQFMNVQTPMLQNMMNNYIDQSKNLFVQMQDQMQDQTRAMFSTFRSRRAGTRADASRQARPAAVAVRERSRRGAPAFAGLIRRNRPPVSGGSGSGRCQILWLH